LPASFFSAFVIWNAFPRFPSAPICCLPPVRAPAAHCLYLLPYIYSEYIFDYVAVAINGADLRAGQMQAGGLRLAELLFQRIFDLGRVSAPSSAACPLPACLPPNAYACYQASTKHLY
jgi:hypothetical protein